MVTRIRRSARKRVDAFDALADPLRRSIVELLWAGGEATAGSIAAAFPAISRPAVSRHLRVLRAARLLRVRGVGRERLYSLDARGIDDLDAWVERYRATWQRRFIVMRGSAA